jgi:2-polyprenyl-6-methoxyphenol hydroxylase-like FAD-dependent oxidoreductase
MKKILIMGGGTSGCIAALVLKKRFPDFYISIVESKNIGIVGVGEGSTEHWKYFCDFVGIDLYEAIRECDCTFKYGIMFDKWDDQPFLSSIIMQV